MSARRFIQPAFVVPLVIGSCFLSQLLMAQENTENKTDRQTPEMKLFAHLDQDGDGKLTADEVPPERFRFFEHLLRVAGKVNDGELTKAEFIEALKPDDLKVVAPQNLGIGGGGGAAFMRDPKAFFKRLDSNQDGIVTLAEAPKEFRPQVERWLTVRLGKGKEGSMTLEDLQTIVAENLARDGGRPQGMPAGTMPPGAGRDGLAALLLRKLDANGDGKLSREELQKVGDLFDDLDRDHDGFLEPAELSGFPAGARPDTGTAKGTSSEIKDSPAATVSGAAKPAGNTGTGAGAARRKAGRPGGQPAQGPLKRFDTNGDGKISRDEAQGKLKENFDKIDVNGDGFLEPDEIRKALAAIGSK